MPKTEPKSIEIEWEGVDLSLNKWYANRHFSYRIKEKQFWSSLFLTLLPKRYKKIDKYEITLLFNSRLDASNTVPMVKILEDTMKKESYIIDDSRKYCKGIHLIPDDSLRKKHYKLIVNIISYADTED